MHQEYDFPLREYNAKENDFEDYFPETFRSYVLTLSSKTYRGHTSSLANEFTKLIRNLGIDNVIFLGDMKFAWLSGNSDYKPAKEALEYLAANKLGKRFNGALKVSLSELTIFMKHIAWLVRTNSVVSYVHFMNEAQTILGSICQYGNLHISTMNKMSDKQFRGEINNTHFEYASSEECSSQFPKGEIEGRKFLK